MRDIATVAGVGVDWQKGEFLVTTQTIAASEAKKRKKGAVDVSSTHAPTMFEAIRDFIIAEGKKQGWQHVESLVIGKELATKGVTPIIDFLARDHEPRFLMSVFMADGRAEPIMKIEPASAPVPAIAMNRALKEQKGLGKAPTVTFLQMLKRVSNPLTDAYIPIIHSVDNGARFEIFGTAVFNGDRVKGTLDPFETRGMLRILGDLKGGMQRVPVQLSGQTPPLLVDVEIKSSKSSIKAEIKHNRPIIHIKIKESGFIGDTRSTCPVKKVDLHCVEQTYEKTVKKEAEDVLKKIQKKYKANIFDFHRAIQIADKTYWNDYKKEWKEMYPEIETEIEVECHITATGLIEKNPRSIR